MGMTLKGRYQIEDLVGQDGTGAVYCVRDLEADRLVTLRRFFPMGISGGGFIDEERQGFSKTLEALKGVRHEGLRGVLDGGVDEVDGIPYLVMERVEGRTLGEYLKDGPLEAERAVDLAGTGLEVLSFLEEVFGEGSWWIEMEPDTVMVAEDGEAFTFWICPFQWLGVAERDGGVKGLGCLVEHVMGWQDRAVPAAAAAGLGGWVAGAKQGEWTTAEAFRELIRVRSFWTGEVVEEEPVPEVEARVVLAGEPAGAATLAPGGVRPPPRDVPAGSGSNRRGLWMAMGLAVVVLMLGGIGWALIAMRAAKGEGRRSGQDTPAGRVVAVEPAPVTPSGELSPQERIDRQVKRTTEAMGFAGEDGEEPREPGPSKARLFGPGDGPALRNWVGATVNLEGRLLRVRDSQSGKTRYLEFTEQRKKDDVCCRFRAQDREGMRLEDLKKLEGKTLRFMGLVQIEKGTGRILLHLDHPGQIQVVGE